MIARRTMINVADNSGAQRLMVIGILTGSKRRYATLGDIIVGAVKEADPRKEIKRHSVVRAVIIRTKKEVRRKDGTYIRFDDNACVLIDPKTREPLGKRIFGPVAREVKEKGFEKVAALTKDLV